MPTDISTDINSTLKQEKQKLAERIVELQYERQPEIWKPYGDPGREKSVRDSGYHLSYLAAALDADDPILFIEYLAWAKSIFVNLHFPENVLATTLQCTRQALIEGLPQGLCAPALAMIDNGLQSLDATPIIVPTFIEKDNLLARQFLDFLLSGNRQAASQLILEAVKAGIPVRDIYLRVFQNTQREVGRLWQTNQISVAQEHFCSAATQMVMSQLYPYIFSSRRTDRRMVMACVGGELHEIGARMVADFFEMEGWDTYFLGANTPHQSIIQTVVEHNADLLAISVTMTFHISKVREIIQGLRQSGNLRTKVLVGGFPFNLSHDLWKRVGADGFAPDAQSALTEAERIS